LGQVIGSNGSPSGTHRTLLLHAYRVDIEATEKTAEELLRMAKQESFEIWTPFARMFSGWVLVERGQFDQGLDETKRGIKMWQETGSTLNQTLAMAMLGLSLWKAGRADEALATLEARPSTPRLERSCTSRPRSTA
jgi:hypothetical protein